jgi:signal transduction histidine kinase/DNA-binding NarL/FixJ family response regulator
MSCTLARKITAVVVAASALALCTMTTAFLVFDHMWFRGELRRQLASMADVVGENAASPLSHGDPRAATEVLLATRSDRAVVTACLYGLSGELFAGYERPQAPWHCPATLTQVPPAKAAYVSESRAVFRDGEALGTLYLTADTKALRLLLDHLLVLAAALSLLSLAVGWLAGLLLQRKISRPVAALARVMYQVSAEHNFTARVAVGGSGEIAQLGETFNTMLEEIQRRDQQLQQSTLALEEELARREEINRQLTKAKQEAEIANRSKSEFLANMSHEIRTPMNGIIGMTELALETNLSAEQREYLSTVKLSADSLRLIINDILDFSKIEVGRLELDCFEFNLHEVMENTLKGIAARAHQKGLELVYDIRPSVPDVVVGDGHRLHQILLNLVGNAIKFTERGEVVVTLEAELERGPGVVHLLVRDTGIGIAPEKHGAIFDAFSQADSSYSRRYGGTGLGLAITSRLVRLMGGEIWVRSEPGQGSEFHVVLPLPAGAPSGLVIPECLQGVTTLIVDDNLTQRKLLTAMLSRWRMQPDSVESAMRGLSAIEAAASANTPYRLVLIDGNMPEMDGFEMAARIQRNPRLAGATILMLSPGLRSDDISRCRQLGISAYIIKPIRRLELLNTIVRVLQEKPAEPALQNKLGEKQPHWRLRILAAEDNRVNQRLLARLLEKEGHTVKLVDDGEAAVTASGQNNFDVVLMDVQMPVMDGLEATRRIRHREAEAGKHLPIIALTAHAMKGDRERCLEAGMDAYVTKPVQKQELLQMIYQCSAHADHRVAHDCRPAPQPGLAGEPGVLDVNHALERMAGDQQAFTKLCELFLEDTRELPAILLRAMENNDNQAVARAAHQLKASVGAIGGARACYAATTLERQTQADDRVGITAAAALLQRELDRLQAAVSRWLAARSAASLPLANGDGIAAALPPI